MKRQLVWHAIRPLAWPWHRTGRAVVRWAPLVSRIVAAVLGGYAVAALVALACTAWPGAAGAGMMAGMQLSFLAYAGAVVWVFAVRSARRAWLGLVVAAAALGLAALPLWWSTGGSAP